MIVLSTVNLQTQSVPISLRSVLRIVAAYIAWLQSGHHAILHLVGISESTRQLTGYAQNITYSL